MKIPIIAVAAGVSLLFPALAQDISRGARLYGETASVIGQPIAACASCHADAWTLRELVRNRGGQPDDLQAFTRWLSAVFTGAQPGAANAKAQYRGVLRPADIRDLAAYIAQAKRAAYRTPELALSGSRSK